MKLTGLFYAARIFVENHSSQSEKCVCPGARLFLFVSQSTGRGATNRHAEFVFHSFINFSSVGSTALKKCPEKFIRFFWLGLAAMTNLPGKICTTDRLILLQKYNETLLQSSPTNTEPNARHRDGNRLPEDDDTRNF